MARYQPAARAKGPTTAYPTRERDFNTKDLSNVLSNTAMFDS
jgi:hypothetical protein